MIHPGTSLRFISPEVGHGVVATEFIPRGTLTWVLDDLDRRLTPAQAAFHEADFGDVLRRYGFVDREGCTILCWDHGRFVNHSCNPTCASGGNDTFEIAIRDIYPGEELTDDYGELLDHAPFRCRCRQPGCRGVVRGEDGDEVERRLTQEVQAALGLAARVEQPLARFGLRHDVLSPHLTLASLDARSLSA